MYLKSIEIHGFKSFANKTYLQFHNGITAIVGPNGSGKSNVADAVRWVLGEQKTRQLRSSKMEDVIFSGTDNRKPMGYAYVAITFDNSDRQLNIDYSEVTVSRRLFRSGESEYLINGSQVRLKDVNELFYDTGIGKEGYSIIGQGQIDKILSGKADERRELFDEAAGIVKYKRRKNEAVKKLNDQNQNLVRVSDILAELERQVGPLEKESIKAKQYLELKDELKRNDVNLFLIEYDGFKDKQASLDERIKIASEHMQQTSDNLEQIKRDYGKLDEEITSSTKDREDKIERLSNLNIESQKIQGSIDVLNEQIKGNTSNKAYIEERKNSITDNLKIADDVIDDITSKMASSEAEIKTIVKDKSELSDEIALKKDEILHMEEELEDKKNTAIEIIKTKADIREKIQKYDTLLEQSNIRKSEVASRLIEFETQKSSQDEIIEGLKAELDDVSKEILDIKQALLENTEKQKNAVSDRKNLIDAQSKNRERFHQANSTLDALKNITERYEGYGNSIRKVMELKEHDKGIIGVVADIIITDKKYENAIETALGGNIQNIVTDTETTAKNAIEYLKKGKYGRATFLPLSSMPESVNFNTPDALDEKGAIGLASELVNVKDKYSGVVRYLLGRIMVVDNIDNAIRIARKYKYKVRIVTLEGEYLNVGGSISGGAFKNNSNLLGRRREIEALTEEIEALTKDFDRIKSEIREAESTIDVINEEIRKIREALSSQQIIQNTVQLKYDQAKDQKDRIISLQEDVKNENTNISEQIDELTSSTSALSTELKDYEDSEVNIEKEIKELTSRAEKEKALASEMSEKLESVNLELSSKKQAHEFIAANLERNRQDKNKLLEELSKINLQLEDSDNDNAKKSTEIEELIRNLNSLGEEIKLLQTQIEEDQKHIEEISQSHKEYFDQREKLQTEYSDLDKEVYRLSTQKENLLENMSHREQYMWEEYELTYRKACEFRDPEAPGKTEIGKTIADIRRKIRLLGDINIKAIDDYKEVNERYTFMKEQHDDLMQAKENLLSVIDELEVGMRKQFKEKFEEIRVEFDKVFKELFGGGKGTIELGEADDILDAEIYIISQPPGKKLQNMMQLSGGEKALTAISLLFAIQNLKPSPFCLLDEIEAALDGSNVVRFAQYLHKLTENTQFIVITHRQGTMSCADRLYGITMQEKGVSALVSVDLLKNSISK